MSTAIERVASLIARAVHPTTPEEESRTSAVIACRTIYEHGLSVGGDSDAAYRAGYIDGATDARRAASPPTTSPCRRVIRARFRGACPNCGARWDEGDRIAWAKGGGATCLDCREAGL